MKLKSKLIENLEKISNELETLNKNMNDLIEIVSVLVDAVDALTAGVTTQLNKILEEGIVWRGARRTE